MTGTHRPYHMPGYVGPMSIKSMVRGVGRWRTADGVFAVQPGTVLILEHGQHYSLTLEGDMAIETFCPFFAPSLVREATRARRQSLSRLLARPVDEDAGMPTLIECVRPASPPLTAGLARLRRAISGRDAALDAHACLMELLDAVLDEVVGERRAIDAVAAARASTRDELYRRVLRARDVIHDQLDRPLTLDSMARVACLSPYHFHRSFRAIVGVTPARYLSECRLQRARELLQATSYPVTEICLAVGFSSLGSFSAAFCRRFGRSPSAARDRVGK